jgi:GT2 family glycosyltransferase
MTESVAAVVVTYNRARLLLECLDALLRQTRPLQRIVLVDNASTDNTAELLRGQGYLDHPLIDYLRLPGNTGGAGGFHAGVKRAHEAGHDWIWVMDDDAEPADDALERLAPAFARPGIGGAAGMTFNPDGSPQLEHRGWLELRGYSQRAHRQLDPAALGGALDISFASFVGLAFPRSAVERIGLPMAEMFIRGDDLEYCVRLAGLGPLVLVPESRIVHKAAVAANTVERRRFGRSSQRVPLGKLWIDYFPLRNLVWLRRQRCGTRVAALFALRQCSRTALGVLLFDDHRLLRLRFHLGAALDGWNGVFDNDKPRRLLHATLQRTA